MVIKSKNKFKNSKSEKSNSFDTRIFDRISETDMDLIPDVDVDLTSQKLHQDYVIQYCMKNNKQKTKDKFTSSLLQFCWFYEMTPAQLIKEAFEDKSTILIQKEYMQKILSFSDHLQNTTYDVYQGEKITEEREYSSNTIRGKVGDIKSFYRKFGIIIEISSIESLPPAKSLEENEYKFKKEDIEGILNFTNITSQAIVLAQASSGLAGVDLRQLTIYDYENGKKNIKQQIINESGEIEFVDATICMLILRRKKMESRGGHEFVTFLSPEACEAIDAYLAYRNNPNASDEDVKDNASIAYQKRRYDIDIDSTNEETKEDSQKKIHLFVNVKISKQFLHDREDKHRRLSEYSFYRIYKKLSANCGQSTKPHHWNDVRGHNMRKYFGNTLENNTSRPKYVKQMMGHKDGKIDNAYYKPAQEKLQTFYVNQCLPIIQFRKTEVIQFVDADKMRLLELEKLVKASIVRESVSERAEEKASNATSFAEKIKFKSIAHKYQTHADNAEFRQRKFTKNQDLTEEDEEALLRNFDEGNPVDEDKEDARMNVIFNKYVQPALESDEYKKVSKEIEEEGIDDGFKEDIDED